MAVSQTAVDFFFTTSIAILNTFSWLWLFKSWRLLLRSPLLAVVGRLFNDDLPTNTVVLWNRCTVVHGATTVVGAVVGCASLLTINRF